MTRRAAALVLSLALALVACEAPVGPVETSLDPTGILMVAVGERVQSQFTNEAMAQAVSDAQLLAERNGRDLGYPWLDPATGELVLSAVTARGRELIQAAGITVPHRIRDVAHGYTELESIKDGATFLRSQGVPGAAAIYATLPDQRDNRALIVISVMSRPLLEYLASHYPPDAIAIQVDPSGPGGGY